MHSTDIDKFGGKWRVFWTPTRWVYETNARRSADDMLTELEAFDESQAQALAEGLASCDKSGIYYRAKWLARQGEALALAAIERAR